MSSFTNHLANIRPIKHCFSYVFFFPFWVRLPITRKLSCLNFFFWYKDVTFFARNSCLSCHHRPFADKSEWPVCVHKNATILNRILQWKLRQNEQLLCTVWMSNRTVLFGPAESSKGKGLGFFFWKELTISEGLLFFNRWRKICVCLCLAPCLCIKDKNVSLIWNISTNVVINCKF